MNSHQDDGIVVHGTGLMSVTCDSTLDLQATMRDRFGHQAFRPGQEEVVSAVLGGRDVLAVRPTGSGKSLGYQLPALMLPATTVVVSPLISLMKDQVDELNRRGVPCGALHSMLSSEMRRETMRAARAGQLRLLYVAPERFASEQFARLLADLRVARFVIDEAHCVSEWGHDFRPDYRRLRRAVSACRTVEGHRRPKSATISWRCSGWNPRRCWSPASIGPTGMGIDRPDVDAVVHFAIPGSVEAYYQEIGRAGRDGRPATATLLWDRSDVSIREFLIDSPRRQKTARGGVELSAEEVARRKEIEHRKLARMISYAETAACLRAMILRYFGDPAVRIPCGACGNCDPHAGMSREGSRRYRFSRRGRLPGRW